MGELLNLAEGTEIVGRYVVRSTIGVGGMGELYLCFDKEKGREVVAKFALKEELQYERGRALFEKEFSVLSTIQHRNIVQCFDFHTLENGHPFFTMEHLKGKTLSEFLQARAGPVTSLQATREMLGVLHGVAGALCCTHSFGVLHHDLKPENIFLLFSSTQGEERIEMAKLLDFGLVLDRDNHTPVEAGQGSLFYKSPEQYQKKKLTIPSEIYAFGSLAYEVFSGERPFDLREQEERIPIPFVIERILGRRHCVGTVRYLKEIHPRIREMMNRTIQICMEKESDLRYQSMEQVQGRLQALREQLERPLLWERIRANFRGTAR